MNVDDAKRQRRKDICRVKAERDALFQQALPNLEKAYQVDPKNKEYKTNLKKVYIQV